MKYFETIFGWCIAGFAVLCAVLFLVGCIHSSPRNQTNNFDKVEITVNGGGALTNGTPSVTIGANDQMIDQGDENSGGTGNRVPITTTAQIPTQGSSIGAAVDEVASWVTGGKANGVATGATGTGTVPTADCADGSCEVQ